jgi:hypothetical protein
MSVDVSDAGSTGPCIVSSSRTQAGIRKFNVAFRTRGMRGVSTDEKARGLQCPGKESREIFG